MKDKIFQIGDLQETVDGLKQQLAKSEAKAAAGERRLEAKNKHIHEINRKLQAIQKKIDTIIVEKHNLVSKIRHARKENKDQTDQVKGLVRVNEELLAFTQGKEMELDNMQDEIEKMREMIRIKAEENAILIQDLDNTRKRMEEHIVAEESVKSRYKLLKSKLLETEYKLLQREEALDRLIKHIALAIEGQDCLLEEIEQLQCSLSDAHHKQYESENQLQQSRNTIEELLDKVRSMESEFSKTRTEIAEMREENAIMKTTTRWKAQEVYGLQKEAVDMRQRIHQLEDEILEKEGQIAILRSSFSANYDF